MPVEPQKILQIFLDWTENVNLVCLIIVFQDAGTEVFSTSKDKHLMMVAKRAPVLGARLRVHLQTVVVSSTLLQSLTQMPLIFRFAQFNANSLTQVLPIAPLWRLIKFNFNYDNIYAPILLYYSIYFYL